MLSAIRNDRVWVILLAAWLVVALPASGVLAFVGLWVWPLMLVALPLIVGATASLIFLLSNKSARRAGKGWAVALVGISTSYVVILIPIVGSLEVLYGFLLFADPASGGVDGPDTILFGITRPMLPYLFALIIFYVWPIISLAMLAKPRNSNWSSA